MANQTAQVEQNEKDTKFVAEEETTPTNGDKADTSQMYRNSPAADENDFNSVEETENIQKVEQVPQKQKLQETEKKQQTNDETSRQVPEEQDEEEEDENTTQPNEEQTVKEQSDLAKPTEEKLNSPEPTNTGNFIIPY